MPATSDLPRPVTSHQRRRAADSGEEVEILARRTLGIAVNAIHHGGHTAPLSRLDPSLAARARSLLERRVPAGPELALALELLERATASERRTTAS